MSGNLPSIAQLIDEADELLTDSQHPLDEKQARKLSLMMLRQIVNLQFEIQREIADWKTEVKNRRERVDIQITELKGTVNEIKGTLEDYPTLKKTVSELGTTVHEIKRTVSEYPSLLWLLRHKTTPTIRWLTVGVFLIFILYRSYPAFAAWLGLPPLP